MLLLKTESCAQITNTEPNRLLDVRKDQKSILKTLQSQGLCVSAAPPSTLTDGAGDTVPKTMSGGEPNLVTADTLLTSSTL